jgi:hypothetical protein
MLWGNHSVMAILVQGKVCTKKKFEIGTRSFCGAGIWTQGLHHEPLHQPFFVMGFFKIGSRELFAGAGFEPRSS